MNYAKRLFEGVQPHKTRKSRFNLSHEWVHDLSLGKLVPCLLLPTMPGDEFEIQTEFAFRFEPLYFPVMSLVHMQCNYFYIPNRIIWRQTKYGEGMGDGWVTFITMAQDIEAPRVDAQMQTETIGSANDLVLGYMGLPYLFNDTNFGKYIEAVNALPLSAYLAVWDEYYRNPQVEEGRWFNPAGGDQTPEFDAAFADNAPDVGRYRVLSSKWEKDYFTSALPSPQVGDPVLIPFLGNTEATDEPIFRKLSNDLPAGSGAMSSDAAGEPQVAGSGQVYYDPQGFMATIRQLRLAETMQAFKERAMKINQRYRDYIKGLFGNDPTPSQVDVPVWFGYYSSRIQVSDVVTTANTDLATTAAYAGRMDMISRGSSMRCYCAEHGWIMAIMEIKPRTSYGQGVDRFWRWQLPTDYPLEMFATIGDQEIRKEEILFNAKTDEFSKNAETFGYIPRYSEMRYANSRYGTNLQAQPLWGLSLHFGRYWDPENTVGSIYDRLEINRWFVNTEERPGGSAIEGSLRQVQIFKVLPTLFDNNSTQNPIFAHLYHNIFVNRNLPLYSSPRLSV